MDCIDGRRKEEGTERGKQKKGPDCMKSSELGVHNWKKPSVCALLIIKVGQRSGCNALPGADSAFQCGSHQSKDNDALYDVVAPLEMETPTSFQQDPSVEIV